MNATNVLNIRQILICIIWKNTPSAHILRYEYILRKILPPNFGKGGAPLKLNTMLLIYIAGVGREWLRCWIWWMQQGKAISNILTTKYVKPKKKKKLKYTVQEPQKLSARSPEVHYCLREVSVLMVSMLSKNIVADFLMVWVWDLVSWTT